MNKEVNKKLRVLWESMTSKPMPRIEVFNVSKEELVELCKRYMNATSWKKTLLYVNKEHGLFLDGVEIDEKYLKDDRVIDKLLKIPNFEELFASVVGGLVTKTPKFFLIAIYRDQNEKEWAKTLIHELRHIINWGIENKQP